MGEKTVSLRQIVDYFKLEQITGDDSTLERLVKEPDVNRPGFELSGYIRVTDPSRIAIMGNKESEYIGHLSDELQDSRFRRLMQERTPALIVAGGNTVPPIMKQVASELNFPVFSTTQSTGRFMVDLISYLDEMLAPEETVHGVLVVVYGKGVLITGDSGIGKSEAALELIRDGQTLVSDDRVDVLRVHNSLIGIAPELLQGMLEVRGIGVLDVERMFGATCYVKRHKIDMMIHLTREFDELNYDRLGDHSEEFTEYLGVNVPTVQLPVSPGRSTSVLVESAVANFILQEEGYNSSSKFKNRLLDYLSQQNEKRRGKPND